MQFEITDDAALVFASAFYRLVERGEGSITFDGVRA